MSIVLQPADPGLAPGPLAQAVVRLTQRWAEAARAQSIYPAGHHRTAAALEAWRQALDEARALPEGAPAPLRMVFAHGALLAQGVEFRVEGDGGLDWLRERLDHGGLAGLEVLPGADEAGLELLNARLLQVFTDRRERRDPATLWAGEWPSLRLLDRRFEGLFDGDGADARRTQRTWGGTSDALSSATERQTVSRALLKDPGIVARLTAIHARLTAASGPGTDESERVVERLAELLPALAQRSEADMCSIAAGLLEALEDRIEQRPSPEALEGFLDDPALGRRAAFLSAALFRRDVSDEAAQAVRSQTAAGPGGHAGDERYSDDPTSFVEALEALPATPATHWAAEPLEVRGEQVGVLLHLALHHPDAARLAGLEPTLARTLENPEGDALAALRRTLEAAAQRADGQGASQPLERIFGLLRRLDRMPLLRRCGWLVPERIVETFPRDFGEWLRGLDLSGAADRAELLDVMRRLAPAKVLAAGDVLSRVEALGAQGVAEGLLAIPSPALAPLAQILFERRPGETRDLVAGWMRRLQLTGPVAAALHVLDESAPLPDGMLAALLAQLLGLDPPATVGAHVAKSLAQFVRASTGREDRRARRIQALRLLGAYDHPEARQVLQHVAYGRRWWIVPLEDPVMRRAASAALAERGAA